MGALTQEIRAKFEPLIPPQGSPTAMGASPHRLQANDLVGGLITKKKQPHGSLIIKDSIATKVKGYLFEDAFPKGIVNKIFDNSTS